MTGPAAGEDGAPAASGAPAGRAPQDASEDAPEDAPANVSQHAADNIAEDAPEEAGAEAESPLARVLAEIDDEVRRRRHDLPASKERELDALFLRHAPMGSRYGEVDAALQLVDTAAFIDPVVPVDSDLPAGAMIKKGLRSLNLWYIGYVTGQVSEFAAAVSRTLHLLDNGVQDLRRRLPREVTVPVVDAGQAGAWWEAAALDALAGAHGRVLHAACGDGWLVRQLRGRGVDAYGVDPRPGETEAAERRGDDVRGEAVLGHLRAVGHQGLGGVVLSGVVEGVAAGERGELLEVLADRLCEGGVLVVHSLTPSAWFADDAPLEADLAPGRPVRAEVWKLLLEGWSAEVQPGPGGGDYLVVATR